MLTVAIAFMRGSILAALMTKLPLPQIPIAPIRSLSTKVRVPRKSTAGAERLGIVVRRNHVAGLTIALAPEGQIDRHGDEALLGHLRRVQVRALLLHRAHRMPDDDRRVSAHSDRDWWA